MGIDGRKVRWAAALAGAALATAGLATGTVRLPAPAALAQGEGSPGPVTFDHATHVDARPGSCVTCHPGRFSILAGARPAGVPGITHAAMEKGQACGGCHGKQAFGFESCDLCHKQ